MYSNEDVASVYGFLNNTPEGSLRKMLVDKEFTEVHFRLMMKMAKNSSEADFIEAFQNESFPKFSMSANELKVKEKVWDLGKRKLASMGLLNLSQSAA
ncbi:MAG: hypothetical protein KDD25_06685 [Bdellovibrionales bacterium]|nr:hypothetical protein [Bdellovibrionales bacterium]